MALYVTPAACCAAYLYFSQRFIDGSVREAYCILCRIALLITTIHRWLCTWRLIHAVLHSSIFSQRSISVWIIFMGAVGCRQCRCITILHPQCSGSKSFFTSLPKHGMFLMTELFQRGNYHGRLSWYSESLCILYGLLNDICIPEIGSKSHYSRQTCLVSKM